jgi:hypothetical protein
LRGCCEYFVFLLTETCVPIVRGQNWLSRGAEQSSLPYRMLTEARGAVYGASQRAVRIVLTFSATFLGCALMRLMFLVR